MCPKHWRKVPPDLKRHVVACWNVLKSGEPYEGRKKAFDNYIEAVSEAIGVVEHRRMMDDDDPRLIAIQQVTNRTDVDRAVMHRAERVIGFDLFNGRLNPVVILTPGCGVQFEWNFGCLYLEVEIMYDLTIVVLATKQDMVVSEFETRSLAEARARIDQLALELES